MKKDNELNIDSLLKLLFLLLLLSFSFQLKPVTWDFDRSIRRAKSEAIGKVITQLVRKLGIQNKVLLTSADTLKLYYTKLIGPELTVGSQLLSAYFVQDEAWYGDVKYEFKKLRGLETCLDKLPNSRALVDFIIETGSTSKAGNISFAELEMSICKNASLLNHLVQTMKANYNKNITFGVSTVYSMHLNELNLKTEESTVQSIIDQKPARLITDDVPKLMARLGRKRPSSGNPHLMAHTFSSFVIFFMSCIFCLFNLLTI